VEDAGSVLNWDQDWMDQAKFRVPRNLSASKALSDTWRPQIGCCGVTLDGIGKMVFLTDQDVGKNADVQLTVTMRAIEVARCVSTCPLGL
jgi:hypothetical protein